MMFSDNEKISLRQLQCLIISNFTGIFMILLPFYLFMPSAEGSVLSLIISFALGGAVIFALLLAAERKNKRKNTAALKALCLFLFAKTALVNGSYMALAQQAVSVFLLKGQYRFAMAALMAVFAFFICRRGIEPRARLGEITAFILLVSLALVFILVFYECDIRELKWGLSADSRTFGTAVKALLLFSGGEALFFILPYVSRKKGEVKKSALTAFTLLGAITVLLLSEALCVFGLNEVTAKKWPVLQMMKSISFPALLLERQDVLFMGMFIAGICMFAAFTVGSMAVYAEKIFSKANRNISCLASALVVMVCTVFFLNENTLHLVLNAAMVLNAFSLAAAFIYIIVWGDVG